MQVASASGNRYTEGKLPAQEIGHEIKSRFREGD